MFTGIVMEQGRVRRARTRRGLLDLEIEAPRAVRALDRGDSIAVNGVCLTATTVARRRFSAEVMPETLLRSTLGSLQRGSPVNLELPVTLADRLGGHLVQGHVDGTARVARIEEDDGVRRLWLEAADDIVRYVVRKGSIALDGVSLTVADVGRTTFQVALIPHTLAQTTMGIVGVADLVNVEVDLIAKYVERLTGGHAEHRRTLT